VQVVIEVRHVDDLWGRRDLFFCEDRNNVGIWMAITRGELSPPRPTPSNPVGEDVV
jgi:hypothetical protein